MNISLLTLLLKCTAPKSMMEESISKTTGLKQCFVLKWTYLKSTRG